MNPTWNRPLFAAVAVALFTVWALMPPEGTEPRQGRVLVYLDLVGVGAGETHRREFRVDDFYTTMELNYNISRAAHVRAAVVGPDDARHEAEADPVSDTLTLVVHEPAHGDWTFEVRTLETPGVAGHILSGNFTMLGFGGTLRLD